MQFGAVLCGVLVLRWGFGVTVWWVLSKGLAIALGLWAGGFLGLPVAGGIAYSG